jgi:hypothetical protein
MRNIVVNLREVAKKDTRSTLRTSDDYKSLLSSKSRTEETISYF